MSYTIYTDGSCLKNPGAGGWAAIIVDESTGEKTEIHGGEKSTTNNRMEMTAAIASLSLTSEGDEINLFTDSQYLKKAFTENWIVNWKRRNWQTASKSPVKNVDLWKTLDELVSNRKVKFKWVQGHAGDRFNERCDELARAEASKFKNS